MLTTKNIIVNPRLFPIIGESNNLVREISRRFTKYYKRGIKRENRSKLLGYNLFVPKAFSKFESHFREDIMMIEVKVNKKSSILIPSFYTKAQTLRELFELENKKKLKSIYKLSNGSYKINLLALNEAVGSLGTPSITQKSDEEVNLGFATDVKEKSINTWLEAELGERWYKKIIKSMNKGVGILPGGGVISKGLDKIVDKVMSTGRFDSTKKSLTVENFSDGQQRMRAMLEELFKGSVDDENKGEFINHASQIFANENLNQSNVTEWAQGLMEIDANNLLKIEAHLNKLLLQDMKKFIRVSEDVVENLGTSDYFFTIDKFKKKAHDEIERVFEKYSIDPDSLNEPVSMSGKGRLKIFWRNTYKTICLTLLVGILSGGSYTSAGFDKIIKQAEDKVGIHALRKVQTKGMTAEKGLEIAKSSQVHDTSEELRNTATDLSIPGLDRCISKIDEHANDFVHMQEFVSKHGEIPQDQMHDLFILSMIKHIQQKTDFGKALIFSASQSGDGESWWEKTREHAPKAKAELDKQYPGALDDLYNNDSYIEGMIISASKGLNETFDYDNLKSDGKFNDNDAAFANIVFGIVSSSSIGESAGLIYQSGKIEAFKSIFGIGDSKKVKSDTANKMTAKYKKGLKEAEKKIRKLADQCIEELKKEGGVKDLESKVKVAHEQIQKIAESSVDKFGNWLAKFIPGSGRDSYTMKYYDAFIKHLYVEAYELLLQNSFVKPHISDTTDKAIRAGANNPKNLTRFTSLIMLMLCGVSHKWTRREELGSIGVELLRQNKRRNRIFKSMYAMNAIKTAQAIAYCSTMGGLVDKDPDLVKSMGILNNELSNLVSVYQGSPESGYWVINYKKSSTSQSGGGFSEEALDDLSFD